MELKCKKCGHKEKVNKAFWLKVLGGTIVAGGAKAWVAYIFAGTGLALPICTAIIAGGVVIAAYSTEIAKWASKKYPCPKCNSKNWVAIV